MSVPLKLYLELAVTVPLKLYLELAVTVPLKLYLELSVTVPLEQQSCDAFPTAIFSLNCINLFLRNL